MNTDVHPAVAALVLATTVLALALWVWASGVAASIGGPSGLKADPRGHRFVQIQSFLVEHDADGKYVKTHDLGELGVEVLLGGFAFFSNGDILLRRGSDPRSFMDNIRAYQRKTNRNTIVPDEPGSGLIRCNLETMTCDRFGEFDFKATYSVFIDWQTDDVYVSDTTRHLLRKYAWDGIELAAPFGGFRFPNHLMLDDTTLLVADTNHHVIRRLESQSSQFAEDIERIDVIPAIARAAGQIWPSDFGQVGDQWWVNNMQSGMNRGGLYVFDSDWNFVHRIELPAGVDPISILPAGDEVWVSDWNNDVVRRFSAAGESLPDLESAGLENILALAHQKRLTYTVLSYAGIALLVVMLLGLLLRAALSNRSP